ncbi:MAG: hypothetical protein R2769_17510 [Saprospiraceae bacterium]
MTNVRKIKLETTLDENFLPHSPKEYSVKVRKALDKFEETDEIPGFIFLATYTGTDFTHGIPHKVVYKYTGKFWIEYQGEVNKFMQPHGTGMLQLKTYDNEEYNWYNGEFINGNYDKTKGWKYDLKDYFAAKMMPIN